MSQQIYFFEHVASGTFARAHHEQCFAQVIRDGAEVARFRTHMNYQVCCADGLLGYVDSYGKTQLVDLAGDFPQEPRLGPKGLCALIDRERGLVLSNPAYPYQTPDGSTVAGLLVVDIATGAVLEQWATVGALESQEVTLFDTPERRLRPPSSSAIWDASPEVVIGSDSESWALIGTKRLAMGRGPKQTALIHWLGEGLFPRLGAYDLVKGRLVVSGYQGVAAINLDGSIVATWQGHLRDASHKGNQRRPTTTRSAPLIETNEVLVVVDAPTNIRIYSGPRPHKVIALDAETLTHQRDVDFPEVIDAGEVLGVARLSTGELAMVPATLPIWVDKPEGAFEPGDQFVVVGHEPPSLVPAPEAAWYDPVIGNEGALPANLIASAADGARWSLARFLLHQRTPDPRIDTLLDADPQAFESFADAFLDFEDAPLGQWTTAAHARAPDASYGASDDAVDRLVTRIIRGLVPDDPNISLLDAINLEEPLDPAILSALHALEGRRILGPALARVRMLACVLTDHALRRAAELGRAHPGIKVILADQQIAVPKEGPAQARFELHGRGVYVYQAHNATTEPHPPQSTTGLTTCRPTTEWHPQGRGQRCAAALQEVLGVPASELPGDGRHDHVFFASNCELCDEVLVREHHFVLTDGNVHIDGLDSETTCDGDEFDVEPPMSVVLSKSPLSYPARSAGRIGGRPHWWQSPEPVHCCDGLMFYIGHIAAGTLREDIADVGLFGFQCGKCGRAAQVVQMT